MMRNPELRRNLWLEFTSNRMIIGPVLLLVLFATAAAADWSLSRVVQGTVTFPITGAVARWAFLAIVLLWGGRQAAGAVIREIRNRTWDGQRMSALGPWAMTLGKLIGATSYSWMLGLCCLVVYAGVGIYNGVGTAVLVAAASMAGFALVCQTVGLLLSLTRLTRTPGFRPGNITLIHFVALLATGALLLAARVPGWLDIDWYGLRFQGEHFVALTGWFFALWGVVGINRRMRRELHFHNAPWVWMLFLIFFVVYANGVAHRSVLPGAHLMIAFVSIAIFVYLLILFEPKDPEGARRTAGMLGAGRVGAALSAMPLWLLTFGALTLVSAVGAILILAGVFDSDPRFQALSPGRFLIVQLVATFLFVVRDVMIVMAFSVSRENREGAAFAFVVLFILYGALPFITWMGRLFDALPVFWPIGTYSWGWAVGPVAIQALVAAAIFWWRWRAYWRPAAVAQPA